MSGAAGALVTAIDASIPFHSRRREPPSTARAGFPADRRIELRTAGPARREHGGLRTLTRAFGPQDRAPRCPLRAIGMRPGKRVRAAPLVKLKVDRAVDEGEVREALREIPEKRAVGRNGLLRIEA